MPATSADLTFALPASLGLDSLRPIARHLAGLLSDFGVSTVWPCRSYEQLEEALLSGEAHAAWAPPAICAAIEQHGGQTLVHAVRMGARTYRSALLCRTERSIDLKRLDMLTGLSPIRAAWVDPRSVAGCLMPRDYLRWRGADLGLAVEERYLGSYRACFDAVLEGDADLTASFVGRRGAGHVDLLGDYAAELRVLAWTDEIPNDGVVVSPALSPSAARRTAEVLTRAFTSTRTGQELALAFDADGFRPPPTGTYDGVAALLEGVPEAAEPDSSDSGSLARGLMHRFSLMPA